MYFTQPQQYFTLITSLPHIAPAYTVAHPPVSEPRLEERLGMLSRDQIDLIRRLTGFLRGKNGRTRKRNDTEIVAVYDELIAGLSTGPARELVSAIMDIRLIVAALRRRRHAMGPPPAVGNWGRHIILHWRHPDFNLEGRFPWIGRLRHLMETGAVMAVHRAVLDIYWDYFREYAQRHMFDFEAVLVYVARWDLVNGWVQQDAGQGVAHFDELLEEALGEHAGLFDS